MALYGCSHLLYSWIGQRPETQYMYERNKDRLSYQHGGLNFDLTQVKGGQVRRREEPMAQPSSLYVCIDE